MTVFEIVYIENNIYQKRQPAVIKNPGCIMLVLKESNNFALGQNLGLLILQQVQLLG